MRRDAFLAGGFALATVALFPLDRRLANDWQDSSFQAATFAHNAARALSSGGGGAAWLAGSTALYAAGRLGHSPHLAETGLHSAEAVLLANALTLVIKDAAGRARPEVNVDRPNDFAFGRGFGDIDHQSFPSGHSASSFAAAASISSEVSAHWPHASWYVAPPLYGLATLVGLSRMYNNKHWASDVVVGAGIGTFSGLKVVRYNHAHEGNWIERALLRTAVIPDGSGGLAITLHEQF